MANEKDAAAEAAGEEKLVQKSDEKPEADEAEADDAAEDEGETETEGDDAEAEGEKSEGDDAAGDTSEDGKPSKSKLKRERIKARIASLEEIANAARQRAESAEATLRALTDEAGPEPKRENYEGREDDYIADRAAWRAEQSAIARQKKAAEATKTEASRNAGDSKLNLFRERTMALSDRFADIEAKVLNDPTLPIDGATAEILMDSERGPEVAYHLATNRHELQRIQQMPPLARAREIGRIEAILSAPKPKTVTNAPKPVPVVSGGSSKVTKDPEKMTMEEWVEHERKRMARTAQQRRA